MKSSASELGLSDKHLVSSLKTFLTNPSKLRIYLCKIHTVMTETLVVQFTSQFLPGLGMNLDEISKVYV